MSQATAMLSPRRLVLCYAAVALVGLVLMVMAAKSGGSTEVPDPFEKRQLVSTEDSSEQGLSG